MKKISKELEKALEFEDNGSFFETEDDYLHWVHFKNNGVSLKEDEYYLGDYNLNLEELDYMEKYKNE